MSNPRITPLIALVVALFVTTTAWAQQPASRQPTATQQPGAPVSLREFHGWGRFLPGSWRKVRIRKERFGEEGKVNSVSVAEAKTTLMKVSEYDFQIKTESSIEVAGQKYVPAPKTTTRDYFGVPKAAPLKKVRLTDFILNGLKTKCELHEVAVVTDNSKRVTSFHIPLNGSGLVLRQNTLATSKDGTQLFQIDVDVLAQNMPLKVMADTMPCAYVRTVQVTADKQIVTMEAYSQAVPGGVVNQSVKVLDLKGQLVERQTIELIDYGLVVGNAEGQPRGRIFRLRNPARPPRK